MAPANENSSGGSASSKTSFKSFNSSSPVSFAMAMEGSMEGGGHKKGGKKGGGGGGSRVAKKVDAVGFAPPCSPKKGPGIGEPGQQFGTPVSLKDDDHHSDSDQFLSPKQEEDGLGSADDDAATCSSAGLLSEIFTSAESNPAKSFGGISSGGGSAAGPRSKNPAVAAAEQQLLGKSSAPVESILTDPPGGGAVNNRDLGGYPKSSGFQSVTNSELSSSMMANSSNNSGNGLLRELFSSEVSALFINLLQNEVFQTVAAIVVFQAALFFLIDHFFK